MTQSHPNVSIGLPVRDGARYLDEAIRSILNQTYQDFELVISDNASTDRTEAIAREWAAADARVRYVRNPEDIGAAPNFHQCFRMARGRYFKWAAHDDLLHPKYLEPCVEALEMSPEIVLAHTSAEQIDGEGALIGHIPNIPDVNSDDPVQRFTNVVTEERLNLPIFGVMRSDVLATTSSTAASSPPPGWSWLRWPCAAPSSGSMIPSSSIATTPAPRCGQSTTSKSAGSGTTRRGASSGICPVGSSTGSWSSRCGTRPLGLGDRLRATAIIPGQMLGKAGALTRDLLHLGRRLLGRMFGR